nr:MAG TPA: intron associated endonuclease [Caudoviricetes sp.]
MYGYIYKRQNKINGMVYVGQHHYESEDVKLDESYSGSGKYFKRALKLYGESNFTYELIDSADTPEELNDKEILWINKLNTIIPNGYNIALGGQIRFDEDTQREYARKGALSRGTGWHQSDTQKKIASEYMKNREVSTETKCKISKSLVGNSRASSAKGKVFVNDGVNNYRKFPNEVDLSIYKFGMIRPENYSQIVKETLSNRIYINNGVSDKYVKNEELQGFLDSGWQVGRFKSTYEKRGKSISKGKSGTIRIVNSDGVIKYIKPEKMEEFEELGFHRFSNK